MNKGATDFTADAIGYVMVYVMEYITINTNNLEESTQHSHDIYIYYIYIYTYYIYIYHYVIVYIYI